MKWNILHESRGRIRLHLRKPRMSLAEADQLQDYLTNLPGVRTAAVYERTCDVVIVYTESRAGIVRGLAAFRFDTEALAEVPANSPRAVNREYQEKLVNMTIFHLARKLFLPAPLRMVLLRSDFIRSRGAQIDLMQPFALANIHQRFLQALQIVFGKVVLVSSLAVDWPFGVGLRLYIGFAQAVDYDVGMDVACSIIAICMGADQSLMPRKISFCVFQPDGLCTFSC